MIDDLVDASVAVAVPPASVATHAEVADRLLLPDGPRQGKPYRWRDDPVHKTIIEELDSGKWDSFVCPGAVQTGKSLVLVLVPALRNLVFRRSSVVYSQPTKDKLHEAWAGKVAPSIDGAGMGGWIPTDGQGSRGGQTPKFVVFRDPQTHARAGMLYLIHGGGKTEGAQASVTAPTVLIDEVDSFRTAHRIALIGKRADSFGRQAVRIMTTTVKADGEPGTESGSIILGLYADSTASRLHFRCEDCGEWFPMEWENISYDDSDEDAAADSVSIGCPGCGVTHDEEARQRMLRDCRLVHRGQSVTPAGRVMGAAPKTSRLGLLWTALDSTLRDLPTLAVEHLRSKRAAERGDHGLMRSFVRDQLCQPYRDDLLEDEGQTIVPTRGRLAALCQRSEYGLAVDRRDDNGDSVHLCEIPAWAEATTVGVDVQRGGDRAPGRLYYVAQCHGGGRHAIIGWGHVVAAEQGRQPTEPELHHALDRLDGLLRDWDPSAPIVARWVDVGDRADELLRWIRTRRAWSPIKGTGPLKAMDGDLPGWMYCRRQDSYTLTLIETESVTRILHGELLGTEPVGSMALPCDLDRDDTLLRHLCSTVEYEPGKWSVRASDRIHHPEWQRRNDLLDCSVYARCAAYWWDRKPAAPRRRYGAVGNIS